MNKTYDLSTDDITRTEGVIDLDLVLLGRPHVLNTDDALEIVLARGLADDHDVDGCEAGVHTNNFAGDDGVDLWHC